MIISNNRTIYILICLFSIFLSITIKFVRPEYFGNNNLLDIILGSSPNFLFVLGVSFIYALTKVEVEFKKFIGTIFAITLGVIAYEFEQSWTNRTFDIIDLVASILAACVSIAIYYLLNRNICKRST